MIAASAAAGASKMATADVTLPEDGSLYYDYLANFPLKHVIEIDISETEGTGGPARCFTVMKMQAGAIGGGDDWWIGVPYTEDLVTTRDLFNYVKQNNLDDTIVVTEGNDPRRVKREPGDREAAGEEPTRWFTISGTIDLTSGDEDAPANPAVPIAAASNAFHRVRNAASASQTVELPPVRLMSWTIVLPC